MNLQCISEDAIIPLWVILLGATGRLSKNVHYEIVRYSIKLGITYIIREVGKQIVRYLQDRTVMEKLK